MVVHAAILAIGGHWTYAEVPFGFQLKEIGSASPATPTTASAISCKE
jgi:uncharacterized membrane protein YjdF